MVREGRAHPRLVEDAVRLRHGTDAGHALELLGVGLVAELVRADARPALLPRRRAAGLVEHELGVAVDAGAGGADDAVARALEEAARLADGAFVGARADAGRGDGARAGVAEAVDRLAEVAVAARLAGAAALGRGGEVGGGERGGHQGRNRLATHHGFRPCGGAACHGDAGVGCSWWRVREGA